MGKFDFARFNGFAKNSLDDFIATDLLNHDIFNERDMNASAYYYIREYFRKRKKEDDNIYVRCESRLLGKNPDIVVYERGKPVYLFEFKCFPKKKDSISESAIDSDLFKIARIMKKIPSLKWGFFFVIYDADKMLNYSNHHLRKEGLSKITFIGINARRQEKTGYKRKGYDDWRTEFDNLQKAQGKHS